MKIVAWDIYIVVLLLFNTLIWSTPFVYVQFKEVGQGMYLFFSPFCHQITQRSMCIYEKGVIDDCYNQEIIYSQISREIVVKNLNGKGYKLPVCARDLTFYLFMLIGGIIIYFYKGKRYNKPPPLWLFILLIMPLAIDGTTQILGLRQSTNIIRLITGSIAGFGMPFFIISLINKWKLQKNKIDRNKKIHAKRKNKKKDKG